MLPVCRDAKKAGSGWVYGGSDPDLIKAPYLESGLCPSFVYCMLDYD